MRYLKIVLVLIMLFAFASIGLAQTKVMSYNIRYDNPKDGDNWWGLRKDEVVDLISYYHADFIGLQEAMPNQLTFITEHLEGYSSIGHSRDGVNTNSEGAPILYEKAKYELLEQKTFWLSETPEKVSKGWDAALNRIVVYGAFKDKKTEETIHVFNAHFDHRGTTARLKSAALLATTVLERQLKNEKIVLMGDFNSEPDAPPIKTLEQVVTDSYKSKDVPVYGPIGTFNSFDTLLPVTRRIDYIFTKNIEVKSYRCIDDRRKNNLHVSDHLPVMISF